MFRAFVHPTQSVLWAWTVDDSTWTQFAGQLGDASLQNISLLVSLQPMDVKQACAAVSGTPIGRTKFRMVHAVGRLKFDMDPIDVGAQVPEVNRLCVEGRAAFKVKVSSIMDQSSVLEVEDVLSLRCQVQVAGRGGSHEIGGITDDQLLVVSALVEVGVAVYQFRGSHWVNAVPRI